MIKEIVCCIVSGFVLVYLVWSFIMGSFNPFIWSTSLLMYDIIISCIVSVFVLMVYFVSKERKK